MGASIGMAASLPELGPALGRLVHPASARGTDRLLASVRIALVTRLLDAAGAARAALAEGDEEAAHQALAPSVWAAAWNQAAEEAAAVVIEKLEARITSAAVAARMPAWRLDRHRITPAEHRAIHARLGAGAGAMLREAAGLEQASRAQWGEQVLATARRVESAWAALLAAADRELAEWGPDIEQVAAWRRARWPLWTVTGVVLALALWAGLLLGGYLPIPQALRPVAEMLWGRL